MNFSEKIHLIPKPYNENTITSFRYSVYQYDNFRAIFNVMLIDISNTVIDIKKIYMEREDINKSDNTDLYNINFISSKLNMTIDNNNTDNFETIYYTELGIDTDRNIIFPNLYYDDNLYSIQNDYHILEFDSNKNVIINSSIIIEDNKLVLPSNYSINEKGLVKTIDGNYVLIKYSLITI
jgi:hypothetical protein